MPPMRPMRGVALVAMVRNATSVEQAVRDAVAMVGGLPDLTGKTVLLKVCLNMGDPSPYSTNSVRLVRRSRWCRTRRHADHRRRSIESRNDDGRCFHQGGSRYRDHHVGSGQGIPVEQMDVRHRGHADDAIDTPQPRRTGRMGLRRTRSAPRSITSSTSVAVRATRLPARTTRWR